MNRNEQVRRRLEAVEAPEPPKDLLDRIQGEIPGDLATLTAPPQRSTSGPRWWQAAAAVFLLLGGGWLAWTWTSDPVGPDFGTVESLAYEPAAPERARERAVPSPVPMEQAVAERKETESAAQSVVADESRRAAKPVTRQLARPGIAVAPPPPAAPSVATSPALPAPAAAKVEEGVLGAVVGGVVGGVLHDNRTEAVAQAITVTAQAPSTGGTAEPNDQPYGDVFFRTYGTNPFVDTEDDAQSTFGLDVDTGSYTVARRYLRDGHLPPPEAIRVEEILNAFRYGDAAPRSDDFAIYTAGAEWPFPRGERYHGLRFGIRAREVSVAERKPATLIFTVDVSGSMARENRLGLVKQALHLLLDQLDRGDRIGLVVYGTQAEVLLEPTSDHDAIRSAIDSLTPGGSTNAEDGLLRAYDLANRYYRDGAINRVILCSDGVANVGRTGPESILDRIGTSARRGIELTTVGFGMGNYNDILMEQLANQGNGQYAYVDTIAEARRIFVENLTGTLQTIARDAKVQVEFNPAVVARYRLLGYENRDIADERFRDDSVDAGEIGAGHAVTALYEIKLHRSVSRNDRVATIHLRYRDVEAGDAVREIEEDVYVRDIAREWEDADPSLRLATLAATFGELLKQSYWVREVEPGTVTAALDRLARETEDPAVEGLASLAHRAARLLSADRPD
ncbi:MAG: YfbK domain-containing protein [Thermoanaerobaculia bacterium]